MMWAAASAGLPQPLMASTSSCNKSIYVMPQQSKLNNTYDRNPQDGKTIQTSHSPDQTL